MLCISFHDCIFLRNRLQIPNNESLGNASGVTPNQKSMVIEDQRGHDEEEVEGESEYAMDEV